MTSHRIVFEGPSELAVAVATALADADGLELTSSDPISKLDGDTVRLGMAADGSVDALASVVAALRADLPASATITVDEA